MAERHKSALKRVRQTKKRREKNRYYAQTMRNELKEIRLSSNKEEAVKQIPEITSKIDKLMKRGQIHKNKAANLKSKLMKKLKIK